MQLIGISYITQLHIKLHGLKLHGLILHGFLNYTIKLQDLPYVILQIRIKFLCNITILKAGVLQRSEQATHPPARASARGGVGG